MVCSKSFRAWAIVTAVSAALLARMAGLHPVLIAVSTGLMGYVLVLLVPSIVLESVRNRIRV